MESLYEITGNLLALMEAACDGDPDRLRAVCSTLEAETEVFALKVESYIKAIRSLEAGADAAKSEADRLSKLAKTRSSAADRLKAALAESMRAVGERKVETPIGRVGFRKCPPKVVIDNERSLPRSFLRHPDPVVDKQALKEALLKGAVAGAHLEAGESLRIY